MIHKKIDNVLWHTGVNWREFGHIWMGLGEGFFCIFVDTYVYYTIKYKSSWEDSVAVMELYHSDPPSKEPPLRSWLGTSSSWTFRYVLNQRPHFLWAIPSQWPNVTRAGYACLVGNSSSRKFFLRDSALGQPRFSNNSTAIPVEALSTQLLPLHLFFLRCQNWSGSEGSLHLLALPVSCAGIPSSPTPCPISCSSKLRGSKLM